MYVHSVLCVNRTASYDYCHVSVCAVINAETTHLADDHAFVHFVSRFLFAELLPRVLLEF
jgi:hypothetical protein